MQQEEAPTLATASAVRSYRTNQDGPYVTGPGNHFVVDSVPPLDGPNEEMNPLDAILGALATCGTFVYERAAQEMDIPANSISTTVQGDFNPCRRQGWLGESPHPGAPRAHDCGWSQR